MKELCHLPVMPKQCIELLNVHSDGIYVDATAGGGGHSSLILSSLSEDGKLIDVDRDEEALARCRQRFAADKRVTYVHSDYKNFGNVLKEAGVNKADGILVDCGLSSFQIDDPERGFSYMTDAAPLDMRMDKSSKFSAVDVVNGYSEEKLYEIIRDYGEEKFAKSIAKKITEERKKKSIETCGRLVAIIDEAVPQAAKHYGHPAKRTFQAVRIEVNGELAGLANSVRFMAESLTSGGRLVILTFHSLEDRIVKNCFSDCACDCICPPELPICVCSHRAIGKILTRKPITADAEELEFNPRAKSAKLRALEKL